MAKIFKVPANISYEFSIENWEEAETKYKQEVKDFVLSIRKPSKNVGEIVKFSVADGYAEYMIASMRPLELIHLEHGDGYRFMMDHKLDAKTVNAYLSFEKSLKK